MNFNDYQQAVAYRFKSSFSTVDALMVAVSGILIELDEVGRATTKANEHEELGDVLFYIAYTSSLTRAIMPIEHRELTYERMMTNLMQALGLIHKAKRGTRELSDHDIFLISHAARLAHHWIVQQGVDMKSLYQANIKKVSSL